ncbi:MAG: class I SAM-dependent methyltransferase, partial [Anaerolineae bacterium]|nr:class I SAM-dependent methyltransferase [Anaerolineae bacterium]
LVTCLEAIEFMNRPYAAIEEMIRVTRPGGWLLLTNRRGTDAHLMPGKTWSRERAYQIYTEKYGLLEVEILPWQDLYDLVWARKPGESLPVRVRPLEEIWLCSRCHTPTLIQDENGYRCGTCQKRVSVARDGVIEATVENLPFGIGF